MKIIDFPQKPSKGDVRAFRFAQDIDAVVVAYVKQGMDPLEACVVLANRLGEMAQAAHRTESPFSSLDVLLDFLQNHMRRRADGEEKRVQEAEDMGTPGGTD
jgi:hypothetical protein